MFVCCVVGDCVAGRAPDAVCSLRGVESSSLCGLAQRWHGELVVGECCEGNESSWSGDVGHDESVEVVEHCSGDDLAECSVVAFVGALERSQVRISLLFEDDDRWVAEAYEH